MTRAIFPIIMGVTTGASSGGIQYLEGQPISVASALIVAGAVGGACLWIEHRFTRLEARFDDLACQRNGCPLSSKKKKRKL